MRRCKGWKRGPSRGNVSPNGVDPRAGAAARNWTRSGKRQVFLQDANSLVMDPEELAAILRHLQDRFPE